MPCDLDYIPERLQRSGREVLNTFSVGEFLYRRCKPEELENPYEKISITELSHNRSGNDNILSEQDDVLWSIRDDEFQKYPDFEVCILTIKDLTENNTYRKEFTQQKDGEEKTSVMELLHEPEECMYPHCVFRIYLGGQVVTFDNYKETISRLKEIRTKLKTELATMIVRKEISQSLAI